MNREKDEKLGRKGERRKWQKESAVIERKGEKV